MKRMKEVQTENQQMKKQMYVTTVGSHITPAFSFLYHIWKMISGLFSVVFSVIPVRIEDRKENHNKHHRNCECHKVHKT